MELNPELIRKMNPPSAAKKFGLLLIVLALQLLPGLRRGAATDRVPGPGEALRSKSSRPTSSECTRMSYFWRECRAMEMFDILPVRFGSSEVSEQLGGRPESRH